MKPKTLQDQRQRQVGLGQLEPHGGRVGLLGLLVAPALHAPLSHYQAASSGAESSQEACFEASERSHATASSGEVCPICAVAGRGRSDLPAPVVLDAPAPTPPLHRGPTDESRLHGIASWAHAAPRAPPAFV